MDPPLISKSCHVRKPANPKNSSSSRHSKIWNKLERKLTDFHVQKHVELINSVRQFFENYQQSPDNIPTATLRLGSNVSNHSGVFDELNRQLIAISPLICRLTPVDCSTLPSIAQRLFDDFIAALGLADEPKFKRALITFENLVQLYKFVSHEEPTAIRESPRKKKSTIRHLGRKKFIIMIEDVASVKPVVLEDLCQILKSHLDEMETCLVFGISSTAQFLHKTLSLRCASCLSLQTFSSPPVSETTNGIFDLLVLNKGFPFKLQPKLFFWLSRFVLDHDFSLTTILHILRVALTLHLDKMDPATLRAIEKPGTNTDVDQALADNSRNDLIREELGKALVTLSGQRIVFQDCYLGLQTKSFTEADMFRKVETIIRVLSADELQHRLQEHLEHYENGELAEKFMEFCERLNQEELEADLSDAAQNLKDLKSRSEWLQAMGENMRKKRTTKLSLVRDDFVSYLKKQAKRVKTLDELRYAKDIYIGNVPTLQAMFAPELRVRLHQALANPSSVLACHCCKVKPNETSASLPAISTAYKLHLECGKMINVYDWLQSYQAVTEDTSEVSIAKFLRALRELQVLGFVKPTTRKVDHVQRLTWGSC
ncbi:origin recognition complex subunit 3-like [Tropilaelaps mercedesae]|uniref:Origin recognition complex subunit 3-like n=1 Tax=Tropilaelaps mercedesae TaxID=418985 RepID=A0A1V9X6F4_9ACAR|nr:origin recognition complex subunit 3-like [Tropilaelaps mercedesae]